MLELYHNLNSGYFVKSPTNATEFVLPPFYAGESITIRYHTLQPTGNPASPFTEVQASAIAVSLCGTAPSVAVNAILSQVGGQLYLQGAFTIPSNTALIPAGAIYADLFFGAVVTVSGDRIYIEQNATLKIPAMSQNASATTFTKTLTAGDLDNLTLDYTSMGLLVAPTYIRIDNAVQKTAADQANIYASLVVTSMTSTTATAELNAPCDVTGRTFNFTVIP
jgi:hypothetical protein